MKESFVLLTEDFLKEEEWNSVRREFGAVCVTMAGMIQMPSHFAKDLAIMEKVKIK